jgi:hypothetical protein
VDKRTSLLELLAEVEPKVAEQNDRLTAQYVAFLGSLNVVKILRRRFQFSAKLKSFGMRLSITETRSKKSLTVGSIDGDSSPLA